MYSSTGSSDISTDSNHSVNYDPEKFNITNFAVTNSRSISAKVISVLENFTELDLDFMIMSETWLRRGKQSKEVLTQLRERGLEIIRRDRDSRGGGVAIIYRTSKLRLKEAFRFPADIEAVCATGKSVENNRKILIISAYIPPKTEAAALLRFKVQVRERLEQAKADLGEFDFYMGGDTNKRNIDDCFENFPTYKQIIDFPTRGSSLLDVCYTNKAEETVEKRLCAPLENSEGTSSDHSVCVFKIASRKHHQYSVKTFKSERYTREGEDKFGTELDTIDWACLDGLDPDAAVDVLNDKLQTIHRNCFPMITHRIRSCDKPWITRRIKRLIRRKKRAFKRGGKNRRWKNKRDATDREILDNKIRFFDKVKERMLSSKNPKDYYAAVRMLQTEEAPNKWSISSLFPGKDDEFIAEQAAAFFNRISNEFEPVPLPVRNAVPPDDPPSMERIVKKIKGMKKPKSRVDGDIDRRLLIRFPEKLATPLHKIYASIYKHTVWPEKWKLETVTLIPKNSAPDSLAQLRNISCTSFFSKVLESFLLDDLKNTITLTSRQYGGIKGQGVDHMLVEVWEEILQGLESKNTAINLMAVDFEKAFNRMDHSKCIESLRQLGGREPTIALVNAFLHERKMSVKLNDARSIPRTVNGGAPQGSILAGFLFCVTINNMLNITKNPLHNTIDNTSLQSGHEESSDPETGSDSTDDEQLRFFRWFKPRVLEDSVQSTMASQTEIEDELGLPTNWVEKEPVVKGYIDDFNVIERIRETDAIAHYTTGPTTTKIHAQGSESIFSSIEEESSAINMKVNPSKTQILCISTSTNAKATSYIRHQNSRIESGQELKILGFNFDRRPTVHCHVEKMITKARGRLWSMRHLKNSGLGQHDLINIYKTYLRPILDYATPCYHPQLTQEQSAEIERVQADAMRIIFGKFVSYGTVIEHEMIEEHRVRREKAVAKFATKALRNEKFSGTWFPTNCPTEYRLRRQEKYQVKHARTERYKKSPLQYMRRLLNRETREQ